MSQNKTKIRLSLFVAAIAMTSVVCMSAFAEEATVKGFSFTSSVAGLNTEDAEVAAASIIETKFDEAPDSEDSDALANSTSRKKVSTSSSSSSSSSSSKSSTSSSSTKTTTTKSSSKSSSSSSSSSKKSTSSDKKSGTSESSTPKASSYMSGAAFKYRGVVTEGGVRYTYYSSNVLRHSLISQWVTDSEGFWRTKNGYYVVAANSSEYSYGSVISTPWGKAKVLDSGCAAGTVDFYVSW